MLKNCLVLAFVIAVPISWGLLENFLQRIGFPRWAFPATGAIALLFALAIVSTQALRAARANPATSLRNE